MIIRFTGIFVLLLFCLKSSAQDSYVGIKTGYTRPTLTGQNHGSVGLKPRNTFAVSLVIATQARAFPVGYSIEPGYMLKGTRPDIDTLDYKFHYLNLPLMIDFYPLKKLKLSLGIEPGYMTRAINQSNDTTEQKISGTYNQRWELSLPVGVSYSVAYFLDLGIRYNKSLTRISRQDALLDRRNLYNQYLQFFLLFKIAN